MADLASLAPHAERLSKADLSGLVGRDEARDEALLLSAAGLTLDARKQRLDAGAWQALLDLVRESDFEARRQKLFAGEVVNETEDRPALHTALRNPDRLRDAGTAERIRQARRATANFAMRAGEGELVVVLDSSDGAY